MKKEEKRKKKRENIIKKLAKGATHATTDFFGITTKKTKSRFVYKESKFYGIVLFYIFISIISCLILAPFAYYKVCELRYNHTYINNKKIVFRGRVYGAYYQFTLGLILVVIILFFISILKQYFLNDILANLRVEIQNLINSLIAAAPTMVITGVLINRLFVWSIRNIFIVSDDQISSYLKVSYLKLSIIKAILTAVLRKIASLVTFGFGEPLLLVIKERYIVSRQYISEKKLYFDGSIFDSYKWFLWRYFLTLATLGLYYPIYLYKQYQWITMHTYFDDGTKHRKRILI